MDGVEFSVAIRSRTLWALAISSACLWYSITSVNSQATIFFEQDAGLSPARATVLYSAIFWCSVGGKFLFGALSDIVPKHKVMLVTASILVAGCLLMFSNGPEGLQLTQNINQLWLFAVVFGLGYGGSFTMIQLACVECFGQRALGKLLGVIIFVDSLGGAAGTFLSGKLSAAAGSYFVPFVAVTAVAAVAVISVMFVRPLQPPPAPAPQPA
jgi:sugar phosphate permease